MEGVHKMEVDPPNLKRSSSAPMINQLALSESTTDTSRAKCVPYSQVGSGTQPRVRRFSASFMPANPASPTPGVRFPSRVSQLKQEEGMDVVGREAAHEKTIQSTLKMSQSWEDLTLTEEPVAPKGRSVADPLLVTIGSPWGGASSSPSPTRTGVVGRQCYSPSMGAPIQRVAFSPSPSPSPTRKAFTTRRSLSPIAVRPSQLSGSLGAVKRKCDLDAEPLYSSPAKRAHLSGGLLMAHPTLSLSSGTPSPAAVSTPESLSSADSPGSCGLFKPVEADNNSSWTSEPFRTSLQGSPPPSSHIGEPSNSSSKMDTGSGDGAFDIHMADNSSCDGGSSFVLRDELTLDGAMDTLVTKPQLQRSFSVPVTLRMSGHLRPRDSPEDSRQNSESP